MVQNRSHKVGSPILPIFAVLSFCLGHTPVQMENVAIFAPIDGKRNVSLLQSASIGSLSMTAFDTICKKYKSPYLAPFSDHANKLRHGAVSTRF